MDDKLEDRWVPLLFEARHLGGSIAFDEFNESYIDNKAIWIQRRGPYWTAWLDYFDSAEVEEVLNTTPVDLYDNSTPNKAPPCLLFVPEDRLFFSTSEDYPAWMLIRATIEVMCQNENFSSLKKAQELKQAISLVTSDASSSTLLVKTLGPGLSNQKRMFKT